MTPKGGKERKEKKERGEGVCSLFLVLFFLRGIEWGGRCYVCGVCILFGCENEGNVSRSMVWRRGGEEGIRRRVKDALKSLVSMMGKGEKGDRRILLADSTCKSLIRCSLSDIYIYAQGLAEVNVNGWDD